MAETWLPVPGWPYLVSHQGDVRNRRGALLKPQPDKDGYPRVTLCDRGRRKTFGVHVLVMLVFAGPCPPGREVRHLDGDKSNCRRWNLRYGTKPENERDKRHTGTGRQGGKGKRNRTDVLIRTGSFPSRDGRDT